MSLREPRPIAGEATLVVPEDLFDLMVPEDPAAALDEFRGVLAQVFPRATAEQVDLLGRGLLAWREHLLLRGTLMHGIIAADRESLGGEPPVHWHIFAGVVDVPVRTDLDVAEAAKLQLEQMYGEHGCYVERFDTAMGWGAGLITDVPVSPESAPVPLARLQQEMAARGDARTVPETMGLTMGLSGSHGSGQALSVIGLCLDGELTELATLVAVIAGESRIQVEGATTPDATDDGHAAS